MHWEAVTAIATAFTACVIAVTALVGVYQLRQLQQQRRDSSAIELMRSLQDEKFAHAFRVVLALPPGASASKLHAASAEIQEAAQILQNRFESLGLMAYRGAISFDVMNDLIGGATISLWVRLKDGIMQVRKEKNYPMYGEWFQWLAEQFEKHDRLHQDPAHMRLRDWKPR